MSVERGGPILLRKGGVSSDRNGHPSVGSVATGDYFWFVANSVAPPRLDSYTTYFHFYLVVSAENQASFLAR